MIQPDNELSILRFYTNHSLDTCNLKSYGSIAFMLFSSWYFLSLSHMHRLQISNTLLQRMLPNTVMLSNSYRSRYRSFRWGICKPSERSERELQITSPVYTNHKNLYREWLMSHLHARLLQRSIWRPVSIHLYYIEVKKEITVWSCSICQWMMN